MDQLCRNGILVTDQGYEQVFTPYLVNRLPPFITSESLLNAYHVLYEESILQLERAQARRLPEILRFVRDNLDRAQSQVRAEPGLTAAARRRAAIVIGTALRLLDDQYQAAEASIQPLIQEEAVRITAAQVKTKPAWLGPPESDFIELDYNRYKGRGFYTQSEALARHFRAVAWLQSIPFRVAKDEELLSALMLGACITPDRFAGDEARHREYRNFFAAYRFLVGAGDDWDLIAAADHLDPERAQSLEEVRRQLLREASSDANRPQINDQVRFAPGDPNLTAEPNFRILSACRTPDAVLFQRTTRVRPHGHKFPDGLEVCAALGSAFARGRIKDPDKARVLATIDASKALFAGDSLYTEYLQALAPLLHVPDPKAPAFMKGQTWQAKSCATALAGWTQLRHTWVLQAKFNAFFAARNVSPAGFVEPEPEFYRRLAHLAARTREVLNAARAFTVDSFDAISALHEVIGVVEAATDDADAYERIRLLPYADAGPGSTDPVRPVVHFALGLKGSRQAIAERLRRIAADLETGKVDPAFAPMLVYYHINLESLWRLLEDTSRWLEALARQQLDGKSPDDADREFLRNYGKTLAQLLFYGGNSYYKPRDDAPRVADVFWHWTEGNLHAGIGRPRALYVLYPWQGKNILCRGAVLPYYEFFSPGRLTDAEWKSTLDSKLRPDMPVWLRPIVRRQGLSQPDRQPAGPGPAER